MSIALLNKQVMNKAVAEETEDLGVFEGKNLIHFNEDGSRVKNVYLIRRR